MTVTETKSEMWGEAERPRVLVVDDEPHLLRVYSRVLRRIGARVEAAGSAERALEILAEGDVEAVVSDIHMPSMNGIGLLRAIRERCGGLPVILITGSPGVETAVEALEGGALHYLFKPVEPGRLAAAVRDAVRAWRNSREGGEQQKRREVEARFERALETLWIAYQPIVSFRSREAVAYEALCRSGEETIPHVGALLETAEALGRIHDLGRVIRARALAGLAAIPSGCELFLNLHPQDLTDDELLDPGSPAGRHASRVVLEVTERRSLAGVGDLMERVRALKARGYRLAVDDLGSGYAGLSSFADLEPEVIKLDMSLVRDVDSHPTKRRLVESMVALGGEMGSQVVVEGVETAEERRALAEIGCDWMQGYLFGHPARAPAPPRF